MDPLDINKANQSIADQLARNRANHWGGFSPPQTGSVLKDFILRALQTAPMALRAPGLGPRMNDFITAQNKMKNVQLESSVDGGTNKIGGWLEPRLSSKDMKNRLPNITPAARHRYIIDKVKEIRAVNE